MALVMDLYPPSPASPPSELNAPTARYRLQVVVVLFSLFLFLAFYLALVAASGWLVWQALIFPLPRIGFWTLLLKCSAVFGSAMLFAFLVKGLLKRSKDDRSDLVEVSEDGEPALFDFLRRLCAETGTPMPKHVYLSPDVNAAVFYDSSILSLFWPVRKNLLIGLGLVNALELSELKAVLGHELGHFSQRTMRVGSYVYVANRIIADMVYGRDAWDELLAKWRALEIRIAVFGWLLTGIVWVVRKVLQLLFSAINVVNASLTRQMELDADRMAVRVAGSDAIVHSLLKLRFADACLGQTFRDLTHAGDHGLFTRDLYVHQSATESYLRKLNRRPTWGLPPEGVGVATHRVFDPSDPEEPPASMWASHPPDAEREANAKAIYLPVELDRRPAWSLFADPARTRETLTRKTMERIRGSQVELRDAAEVQKFLEDERAETTFDPRYHDMYEGRFIEPGDVLVAICAPAPEEVAGLFRAIDALWDDDLALRMTAYKERSQEAAGLGARLGGRRVQLRGKTLSQSEASARLQELEDALAADRAELAELDERVLRAHAAVAKWLDARAGSSLLEELRHRYEFHLGLQSLAGSVQQIPAVLDRALGLLRDGNQLSETEFGQLIAGLTEAHERLQEVLERSEGMSFPVLKNLEAGGSLRAFLLPGALVLSPEGASSIGGDFIQALLGQLGEVDDKLQRLFFKSMGGLLALQEEIVRQARALDSQPQV
ncbi:MAG: M48 family metalloprotease [Sandaracinaceae bacterium]|nr:M48 family metalloprotease [Sandaracinaceae bacterium]